MTVPRTSHFAVRLLNGKVLVGAGGDFNGVNLTTAELFDPDSGTWSPTGNLVGVRLSATATLLPNGKVLVAGGAIGVVNVLVPPVTVGQGAVNTCELYDPFTGTWSPTGAMNSPRSFHTATLLPNGKVLVASGSNGGPSVSSNIPSTEIYDPATGLWTLTGSLAIARSVHTATLLTNGKVLVTGGGNTALIFNQSEVYDPPTGQWSNAGSLATGRLAHTATLLPGGEVLVAAGLISSGALGSAEIYDSATGNWTATARLGTNRGGHAATLLAGGRVLVAGGLNGSTGSITSAELFDSRAVTNLSAASLLPGFAAPDALVTAKASGGLANTTAEDASQNRNPGTTLGGTTVKVRDSAGIERLARLDYVSPTQVNYVLPAGTASGAATVTITSGDGVVSAASLQIMGVAPGIFMLNEVGLAAAVVVRVRNGVQTVDPVFQDTVAGRLALPIDLGPETDQVFLLLFGTGLRFRSALSNVSVKIDGIDALPGYAGLQGDYPGLDQINVTLPRSLAGRGLVNVQLTVDGAAANITRVQFK